MVLVPFMAIFCAMGIYGLIERWMPSKAMWSIISLIGLLNVIHAQHSVSSLLQPKPAHETLSQYISQRPETYFLPSDALKSSPVASELSRVKWDGHQEVRVVFWSDEKPKPSWLTNRANRYTVVAGPSDVNWSYYPSWLGPRRLLAVSLDDARKMKVRLSLPIIPASQEE